MLLSLFQIRESKLALITFLINEWMVSKRITLRTISSLHWLGGGKKSFFNRDQINLQNLIFLQCCENMQGITL